MCSTKTKALYFNSYIININGCRCTIRQVLIELILAQRQCHCDSYGIFAIVLLYYDVTLRKLLYYGRCPKWSVIVPLTWTLRHVAISLSYHFRASLVFCWIWYGRPQACTFSFNPFVLNGCVKITISSRLSEITCTWHNSLLLTEAGGFSLLSFAPLSGGKI